MDYTLYKYSLGIAFLWYIFGAYPNFLHGISPETRKKTLPLQP